MPESTPRTILYKRLLWTLFAKGTMGIDIVATANRVCLSPVDIPFRVTVDRIAYIQGDGASGNVIAGIYYDNGGTPVGANLVVSSVSAAVTAGRLQKKEVTIPATQLDPSLYWLALIFSVGGMANLLRHFTADDPLRTGGSLNPCYYGAAAFALEEPCPAVTLMDNLPIYLRVASVP